MALLDSPVSDNRNASPVRHVRGVKMPCPDEDGAIASIDTNVMGHIFTADIGEVSQRAKPETNEFVVKRVEFAKRGNMHCVTK